MKKIYEKPNARVHTVREKVSICSASCFDDPHRPPHPPGPWWPWGPPHPPGPHHAKEINDVDFEEEVGDE